MSVHIKRYDSTDAKAWNDFISRARNATFLFNREYVDYHNDRFKDHSLMVYNDGGLSALFIANEVSDKIESHGGLTYGGLILEKDTRLERALRYFYHVVKYYSQHRPTISYKRFPAWLAAYPSDEDLYALFLLKATLLQRETNMVLDLNSPASVRRRTSKSHQLFESGKYKIVAADEPTKFWNEILVPNLKERFAAEPVHTADEMKLLMSRFPGNIKLFEVYDDEIVAGAVVYITSNTAHLQYISANKKGRNSDASGILIHYLISKEFSAKEYFSFGTSNFNSGRKLNRGLVNWKEEFGAKTFAADSYEITTANYVELEEYA